MENNFKITDIDCTYVNDYVFVQLWSSQRDHDILSSPSYLARILPQDINDYNYLKDIENLCEIYRVRPEIYEALVVPLTDPTEISYVAGCIQEFFYKVFFHPSCMYEFVNENINGYNLEEITSEDPVTYFKENIYLNMNKYEKISDTNLDFEIKLQIDDQMQENNYINIKIKLKFNNENEKRDKLYKIPSDFDNILVENLAKRICAISTTRHTNIYQEYSALEYSLKIPIELISRKAYPQLFREQFQLIVYLLKKEFL
jgi:hypothetical protein